MPSDKTIGTSHHSLRAHKKAPRPTTTLKYEPATAKSFVRLVIKPHTPHLCRGFWLLPRVSAGRIPYARSIWNACCILKRSKYKRHRSRSNRGYSTVMIYHDQADSSHLAGG